MLNEKQVEKLAKEILNFLIKKKMWIDTAIYFNGKCWSTYNRETGKCHYNDKENIYEEKADPKDYFEWVREPNILSMSFEGIFYRVMNGYAGYDGNKVRVAFEKILAKYGLRYSLGDAWNLTVYYLDD